MVLSPCCLPHCLGLQDWNWSEYPYVNTGMNATVLIDVLRAVRDAVDKEVRRPGQAKLTLSVAVSPHPYVMRNSYDLPAMTRWADA
jgi:hypothetical protein